MDIKVVDDKGEEIKEEVSEVGEPEEKRTDGTLLLEQVGQLFDFKPSELQQYKSELRTLIQYAKTKTKDHSVEGLKWALTDLGIRLGTPPLGEKRIKQLTRYAHLYLETMENEKRLHKMMEG